MVKPEGPRARGTAWLTLFLQATTFRVLAGYLQFNAERHWVADGVDPQMRELLDRGWGVAPIYLGLSRHSFEHTDRATGKQVLNEPAWRAQMTAARGVQDAQEARRLARTAQIPAGSVLWFDNEDPTGVVFQPHEFAYYGAFFTELTTPRDGEPVYRCGLYAHQAIAVQLLLRHPQLWIWEVEYGNNIGRTSLPPLRRTTATDRRFGLDPADRDAVIKAFRVAPQPGEAGPQWVSWPVWRQWQGNNVARIPPAALGPLTTVNDKWDWNSSLVRHPGDPHPTPRLAAPTTGMAWFARLDDIDPGFDSTGLRVQTPRHGRLTIALAGRTPIEVTTDRGFPIDPASELTVLGLAAGAELVVQSAFGDLGSTVFDGAACTPVRPLWDRNILPEVRSPTAIAGAVSAPHRHLFWAATDHGLWCARRDEVHRWDDHVRAGSGLRLHPFAEVAATTQAGQSHVVTVAADGRLVHLAVPRQAANWPPPSAQPIDTPPLVAGGALALGDSGDGVLVAVGIGTDCRLRAWNLRPRDPSPRWSAATVLGRPEDAVHPHTRIAIFRSRAGELIVTAVVGNGRIARFRLTAGTGWGCPAATYVTIPPGLGGVHPLTDLPTLSHGRPAFASVRPGLPGVLLFDPVAGTLLDPDTGTVTPAR
jgi:hypothetical protein